MHHFEIPAPIQNEGIKEFWLSISATIETWYFVQLYNFTHAAWNTTEWEQYDLATCPRMDKRLRNFIFLANLDIRSSFI